MMVSIPISLPSSLLVGTGPIPSKVVSVAEALSSSWAKGHPAAPIVGVIVPTLAFLPQIGNVKQKDWEP